MSRHHPRKLHLVGGLPTVTLCGRETYRLSRTSTTNKGVDRSVCCDTCVIAEAEMERAVVAAGFTRGADAADAVARLREHCADYGYGFDATESRGPSISATMTGGVRVTFEITLTVEEPDGAVRE